MHYITRKTDQNLYELYFASRKMNWSRSGSASCSFDGNFKKSPRKPDKQSVYHCYKWWTFPHDLFYYYFTKSKINAGVVQTWDSLERCVKKSNMGRIFAFSWPRKEEIRWIINLDWLISVAIVHPQAPSHRNILIHRY